jgi:hypothetical protein
MSNDPPTITAGEKSAFNLFKVTFIVSSILILLPMAVIFIDNTIAVDTAILDRRDREFCAILFQVFPMICASSLIALALSEKR